MNGAHYHLLVNHLPILGTLFGLLILVTGLIFKNVSIKRTGLGLLVFAAITVFPAHVTGEGAEEVVENISGVEESYVHEHEEAADTFMSILIALGVIALATLIVDVLKKKFAPILYILTILFSLITMLFAQKTGTTGGEIRHTEIRGKTATQNSGTVTPETENDDD